MTKWTNKEIEYLKENYGKMSVEKMRKTIGKSFNAIVLEAMKLGLKSRAKPWTDEEIKIIQKYYGKIPVIKIEEKINRSWGAITAKAIKLDLTNKISPKCPNELNEREEQIIIGTLLGDANMHVSTGDVYPYLEIWHSLRQIEYLKWFKKELSRFYAKVHTRTGFNSVAQRTTTKCWLTTSLRTKIWQELRDLFYPDGSRHKVLSKEILDKVGPLALAVLYMDDGTNSYGIIKLCTQSFGSKANLIVDLLHNKFEIDSHVNKGHEVVIESHDTEDFLCRIESYILPMFKYKLTGKGLKSPKISVTRKMEFDAAHYLDDYDGKCFNTHGHRYTVKITVNGSINPETGMLIDFVELKKVMEEIDKKFDHKVLNYVDERLKFNATVENLCVVVWDMMKKKLGDMLFAVEINETPDSWAEYRGGH